MIGNQPSVDDIRENYEAEMLRIRQRADRSFFVLMLGQWLFGMACAVIISPQTWTGPNSSTHIHVWTAAGLGGLVIALPCFLIALRSHTWLTRWAVAVSQALMSALLIHLMSGRIEAHFHIFGVLAFLSFYRDRLVYIPIVSLIALDHVVRGLFWPESVFSITEPSLLRALEHAGWVMFETTFLCIGIAHGQARIRATCRLQCELQRERDTLETRVEERTTALLHEQKLMQSIVDSIPHALFWKDRDLSYKGCNAAFARLAGLRSSRTIQGLTDKDLPWTAKQAQRYRDLDMEILAGEQKIISFEERLMGPDGKLLEILRTKTPLLNDRDEVTGMVGVLADVAETKNAKRDRDRLLAESAELAKVIRESPHEVYIFSRDDLKFIEVNRGACRATGYSSEELLGMTPLDLKPEHDEQSFRSLVSAIEKGSDSYLEFQTEHRRKNGELYPAQISLHAAEYQGKPVFTAFVKDLTEVRNLERQLSQAQKLESIGQLSAGVAHEINTPMQFINDNIHFLNDCTSGLFKVIESYQSNLFVDHPSKSWEERKAEATQVADECHFQRMQEQIPVAIQESLEGVDRVIKIVRAMKEFSHPGTTEKVSTDINEAIRSTVTISKNRWKYAADVTLDLAEDLPDVKTLPAELNQVLLNLVVNASDAISERLGESSGEKGTVGIRTYATHAHMVIEVSDTGGGIPEAIRDRIFDPFFTTKDVGKGTGQGLAISYDVIVNKHQGVIDVESELGRGTTFIVKLPLSLHGQQYPDSSAVVATNSWRAANEHVVVE